jgi:hypothetical protein
VSVKALRVYGDAAQVSCGLVGAAFDTGFESHSVFGCMWRTKHRHECEITIDRAELAAL